MNLPGSFIADLPPEAVLSPTLVTEACQTLRRNREQYLASRSTDSLIAVLAETAAKWLDPTYPFRQMALDSTTGFSRQTVLRGLDSFFETITAETLHDLLVLEFGHARRLDSVVATSVEQKAQIAAMVTGPELLVHVGAGNVPNSAWMSLVLGLLVRSAQFMKCARGASLLPRLLAHSLYDTDPKLASCIEIAEWRGGQEDLERALFSQADCVTATGSDETLASIRVRLPAPARFVGYGHRLSFGYIARESLSSANLKRIMQFAGDDIVAWNQLGCLSPHVIYVETGGTLAAEQFAEMLAGELARREATEPRGDLPIEEAAAIASRRGFYQVRADMSEETKIWASADSTAWTVIFEADNRFATSCLNRFVFVKPVKDPVETLVALDGVRGKVSTVGIAAPEWRLQQMAEQFGRWGATRICPLGRMQKPTLNWRHDGRPVLGELVAWTTWERA